MKKLFAAAISGYLALTNAAIAADPVSEQVGGFFGSLTGSYILEDPTNEWRLFGPDVAAGETSYSNIGDGGLGRAVLGYRWSAWDFAVAGQFGSFGDGPSSSGGGNDGFLSAEHLALDAQIGYNSSIGSSDARFALGVRYAEWDHDVDPGGGRSVSHDFSGIGPMVEFDSSTPISDSMTLEIGLGASALFGDIKTSSSGGWSCTDCNTKNTTAFALEGDLGIGFALGNSANAVLGWQAQWWDSVNVDTTDNTDAGGNTGTSGHLLTGPYLEISF